MTSELRDQALRVAGTVDPEVMTGAQAADALEDLAVADKAVAGALLFLALKVARTSAWQGQGFRSPADWLAAKVGCSVAEAKRQLSTAEKAEDLPRTKEAIRNGDLSPEQADAVTDGASADPGAEEDLLASAARDTHKDLREKAAKARAAATGDEERERRIRRNRGIRRGTDGEGAFWARLYGPGVSAALFEELLRPFEELVFRQHRTAGVRSTYEQRSFDAFFLMLAFLRQGTATTGDGGAAPAATSEPTAEADAKAESAAEAGGEAEAGDVTGAGAGPGDCSGPAGSDGSGPPTGPPAPSTGPPGPSTGAPAPAAPPPGRRVWKPPWDPAQALDLPVKLPGGNNVKVIVRVDHTALLRGRTTAGETCEIAGIGPVPVAAVRDILRNDAFLAVVVRKGQDIVNVAHHGRGLNAAQRTAIEDRGLACTNIACNQTINIQIDHRTPWATDPTTQLDNTDPLCSPTCHDLKTHHGHQLEPGTGRRRLLPPDHPDHPGTAGANQPRRRPPADHASGYDPATDTLPIGDALKALMDQRPLTDAEMDQLEARVAHRAAQRHQAAAARPAPKGEMTAQASWC